MYFGNMAIHKFLVDFSRVLNLKNSKIAKIGP